jgi:hypothetical protein
MHLNRRGFLSQEVTLRFMTTEWRRYHMKKLLILLCLAALCMPLVAASDRVALDQRVQASRNVIDNHSTNDILNGTVPPPPGAESFVRAVEAYSRQG